MIMLLSSLPTGAEQTLHQTLYDLHVVDFGQRNILFLDVDDAAADINPLVGYRIDFQLVVNPFVDVGNEQKAADHHHNAGHRINMTDKTEPFPFADAAPHGDKVGNTNTL